MLDRNIFIMLGCVLPMTFGGALAQTGGLPTWEAGLAESSVGTLMDGARKRGSEEAH